MNIQDVLDMIQIRVERHRENAIFMGETQRDNHNQEAVTKELARSGALRQLAIDIKKAMENE